MFGLVWKKEMDKVMDDLRRVCAERINLMNRVEEQEMIIQGLREELSEKKERETDRMGGMSCVMCVNREGNTCKVLPVRGRRAEDDFVCSNFRPAE